MTLLTAALLNAERAVREGNREAALAYMRAAAAASWATRPQANPAISRAIWHLEQAGDPPRKVA